MAKDHSDSSTKKVSKWTKFMDVMERNKLFTGISFLGIAAAPFTGGISILVAGSVVGVLAGARLVKDKIAKAIPAKVKDRWSKIKKFVSDHPAAIVIGMVGVVLAPVTGGASLVLTGLAVAGAGAFEALKRSWQNSSPEANGENHVAQQVQAQQGPNQPYRGQDAPAPSSSNRVYVNSPYPSSSRAAAAGGFHPAPADVCPPRHDSPSSAIPGWHSALPPVRMDPPSPSSVAGRGPSSPSVVKPPVYMDGPPASPGAKPLSHQNRGNRVI